MFIIPGLGDETERPSLATVSPRLDLVYRPCRLKEKQKDQRVSFDMALSNVSSSWEGSCLRTRWTQSSAT